MHAKICNKPYLLQLLSVLDIDTEEGKEIQEILRITDFGPELSADPKTETAAAEDVEILDDERDIVDTESKTVGVEPKIVDMEPNILDIEPNIVDIESKIVDLESKIVVIEPISKREANQETIERSREPAHRTPVDREEL